jgi:hypothetical protein
MTIEDESWGFHTRTFYPRTAEERRLWSNIHAKAETNEGLKDLLNQCIIYYRLLEDKGNE